MDAKVCTKSSSRFHTNSPYQRHFNPTILAHTLLKTEDLISSSPFGKSYVEKIPLSGLDFVKELFFSTMFQGIIKNVSLPYCPGLGEIFRSGFYKLSNTKF